MASARGCARLDLGGKPRCQEVDRARPLLVEHTQRSEAGIGQRAGLADDAMQEVGEIEIGLQEERGLQDPAKCDRVLDRVVGRSLPRGVVRHGGQG